MNKDLAIYLTILLGKDLERQSGVELPTSVYEMIEKRFIDGKFDEIKRFADKWVSEKHKHISEIVDK